MPPNADEQFSKKIRGKTYTKSDSESFCQRLNKNSGIKLNKYIDTKIDCDLSNVAGALWNPESEVDFKLFSYSKIPVGGRLLVKETKLQLV